MDIREIRWVAEPVIAIVIRKMRLPLACVGQVPPIAISPIFFLPFSFPVFSLLSLSVVFILDPRSVSLKSLLKISEPQSLHL